ncbi:MAG: Uma2 family endonuclease [Oculatellaceae cyanobacterium Prado106]|jgi:Uma2 family endonuclease|nr:Uma2 family endonuclease [Oculatellaceae cyanobacterium Prado106]
MVQIPEKTLSLEAFLKQPETKPASEYIHGQVIQKPMPQGKHSKLQGKLVTTINQSVEDQKIALAFPELRCTFGDRSIVPDIAVLVWSRIPTDETGEIANVFAIPPDWTIEILSPDQSTTKVTANILHCLEHGCQMGWLIDPDEGLLIVYPAGQQPQTLEARDSVLPVPAFAAHLQLTVGKILDWLKL